MQEKFYAWMNSPLPIVKSKRFNLNIAPGVFALTAAMVAIAIFMPTK